jgi:hypothetical protein
VNIAKLPEPVRKPKHAYPTACQDNAASAPLWCPQRPKRKPGIADLIGSGLD